MEALTQALDVLGRLDQHLVSVVLISPIANELGELVLLAWRRARQTIVLVTGSTLLLVGALMLVLPGPGLLVMALALALLATEFYWAKRWLARVRERLGEIRGGLQRITDSEGGGGR